jgi:pyridoxamine 5'-phosphate oxidase
MNEQEPIPDLASLRVEYRQQSLSEKDVHADPIRQLVHWLNQAIAAKVNEPNAMVLATSTPDGRPSARVMLCKGIEDGKVVFFTNYQSRKGQMLADNPHGAVVFFWPELERQVRIEGEINKISPTESDAYFASRPLESRLGAWASPQSRAIESREVLEKNMEELRRKCGDGNVPRPPYWGGYALNPSRIEFWQGRPSRLHDRIVYLLEDKGWKIRRLAP